MPPIETVAATEHTFRWSGGELFYRHWAPRSPSRRAVLLFHRGHEHSGRLAELVAELGLEEAHVIAWDARGHGRSPGRRGFAPGGFATLIEDMDAFVHGVCAEHELELEQSVVVAHSVAAVVATTWVHDRHPGIRALVLATPAFRVRLFVPFALPGLRLLDRLRPQAQISSYVSGRLLTHDPEAADDYDRDQLVSRAISNRVLVEMTAAAQRVVADAGAIRTPTLLIQAGADWVVDNDEQDRFFRRLGSRCKQRLDVPEAYHAVFHETSRAATAGAVARFVRERWALEKDDDAIGPDTDAQHERLRRPLAPWHPKRWAFGLTRAAMRGPGALSQGIRTGWRHGFDSGVMLDHVYADRARGGVGIGRLIDRCFLDAIGWRGIRQRKVHLERLLHEAIGHHLDASGHAHVADVAGGPGRYLLDVLAASGEQVHVRCRDRDPTGLAEGRRLAAERGITRIVYQPGDAFDSTSLGELRGWAQVVVASGLYELFADNQPIERSLAGIAAALPVGGHLVYTNQPWHPQLEFIARVLVDREGGPWVMRCRPQAEIDALVRRAGFTKLRTLSDRWGIFTVSLARKTDARRN